MSGMWLGSEPNSMLSSTLNAGSRVLRLAITFCVPIFWRSLPEKVEEAPVKLSFFLSMIPVTTTSLRLVFDSRRMCSFLPPCTFTVWGSMPTYDTTMYFADDGKTMVNAPSTLVVVPLLLFSLAWMVAPIRGSPWSSTTTPLTVSVCAEARKLNRREVITTMANSKVNLATTFLICFNFSIYIFHFAQKYFKKVTI